MGRTDDHKHFHIWMHGNEMQEMKWYLLEVVCIGLLAFSSVLVWIYVLATGAYKGLLNVAIVAAALTFLLEFIWVGVKGYETTMLKNLSVTWLLEIVFSVAGMYLRHVTVLERPETGMGIELYHMIHFLMCLMLSSLMSLVTSV